MDYNNNYNTSKSHLLPMTCRIHFLYIYRIIFLYIYNYIHVDHCKHCKINILEYAYSKDFMFSANQPLGRDLSGVK